MSCGRIQQTGCSVSNVKTECGDHKMNNNRRLTTGDVMKYCQVSRSTVLKWIKSEKLEAYVLPDGQYRVTREALIDFLTAYKMPVDGELVRQASESDNAIPNSGRKQEDR